MTSSLRDLKVYTTYPHSCSYLEDQDFWRLSGIYRDVFLYATPEVQLRDYFVKSDLDADYQDASVSITAKVRNLSDQAEKAAQ